MADRYYSKDCLPKSGDVVYGFVDTAMIRYTVSERIGPTIHCVNDIGFHQIFRWDGRRFARAELGDDQ